MALFDNPSTESGVFNFGIDETAKGYLLETARWAKFLSIVGFVAIALLAIATVFTTMFVGGFGSTLGGRIPVGVIIALYLVMAVLYFFPTYYLFRFSSGIKPAVLNADQAAFNRALSYLRNAFRFIGGLTLVILGIYALVVVIGIATAAMN